MKTVPLTSKESNIFIMCWIKHHIILDHRQRLSQFKKLRQLVRLFLLFVIGIVCPIATQAQRPTPASIDGNIQTINDVTRSNPKMIVSYRGLSRFLGNKVASYLTDGGDLSLFKDYAVLNTSDGRLSLNHNFVLHRKNDRINGVFTAGLRSNVADAFSSIISNSKFSDDIGLSLKYTLIGRGSAYFDSEKQKQQHGIISTAEGPQKISANRERAIIRAKLYTAMTTEANEFETGVDSIKLRDLSATDRNRLTVIKDDLRDKFYAKLREKYLKIFAQEEAKILEDIASHNLISSHWVSFSMYVPVAATKYNVATSFASNFANKELYKWEFAVSFNWIWEGAKCGRVFLYMSPSIVQNNSVNTKNVTAVDLNSYKNLGGTDTLSYGLLESKKSYVGNYDSFVTPILKAQLIWFPKMWQVGLSATVEQNFGKYNPLNGKLGIPVRLKGKGDDSFVNFEAQARFSDLANEISPEKSFSQKTTYGISVGIPFSSILN